MAKVVFGGWEPDGDNNLSNKLELAKRGRKQTLELGELRGRRDSLACVINTLIVKIVEYEAKRSLKTLI